MAQANSDVASPTPFSPFSCNSVGSEVTSDEPGDLGAFATVFHALNYLHQPSIPNTNVNVTPTSSLFVSPSDYDSDAAGASTHWSHHPISSDTIGSSRDSPLNPSSETSSLDHVSVLPNADEKSVPVVMDIADLVEQPSLGYLDEALNFIAEERARLAALLEARVQRSVSPDTLRNEERRRKRRRRKTTKSLVRILHKETLDDESHTDVTERLAADPDEDADNSSSSPDDSFLSLPTTHPRASRTQSSVRRPSPLRLTRSRSTPSLRLTVSIPLDPHVLQLRALAHKLRLLFPDDAKSLSSILSDDFPDSADFIDPRGPSPQPSDTLIHVFIDHSNILIGFLNYLKRNIHHAARKGKHMSHSALALILERGRPISRRALVTSSPLYQPMESAEQLGYDVRIYARVPDTGDGADRRHSGEYRIRGTKKTTSIPIKGHAHKGSNGGTSTESDPVLVTSPQRPSIRGYGNSHSGQGTVQPNGNGAVITTPGGRVRYREQGVDELLQLKLLQAIADVDVPPPNATIVLATGDGNVGQFNEEGFLGCVRIALKKGWRVELYAWEGGLSRAWMREFGEGPYSAKFRIIGMEKFGADLIQI